MMMALDDGDDDVADGDGNDNDGVNLVYDNLGRQMDILGRSRPPQLTLVNLTILNFEKWYF